MSNYEVGTVGVVGPERSLGRIIAIAEEMGTSLGFMPYMYRDAGDIVKIVSEHDKDVDAWLFSGPVPYMLAMDMIGSEKKSFYIPGTEMGLYKAILDYTYDRREILDRVSIDVPKDLYPIEEILAQMDKPPSGIFLKYFDSSVSPEELVSFHRDLWEEGKTQGGLSCLPPVSEELRKSGIPSYWLTTSNREARQVINLMVESLMSSYFKGSQIGVEMIEIENFDKIIGRMKSTYFLQRLELKIKGILIDLCEKIDGSMSDRGNGRYVIISSRGAIEREIHALNETVVQMTAQADMMVVVGIGYGETVISAEVNAYNAMQQSKERRDGGVVIIQEDGVVVEHDDGDEGLSYSPITHDSDLLEKLKSANLSIRTYTRVFAINQKMGWKSFTVKDIASSLQMTERNSRRIMSDLCRAGLAECIGEEDFSARGRPGKIFRLV